MSPWPQSPVSWQGLPSTPALLGLSWTRDHLEARRSSSRGTIITNSINLQSHLSMVSYLQIKLYN